MNETINYRIEELDKILAENGKINSNINRTLIMAYEDSIENKNPLINFDRVIWSEDIAPIVDTFHNEYFGFIYFTNSSDDFEIFSFDVFDFVFKHGR